jgi:hypothetical protein
LPWWAYVKATGSCRTTSDAFWRDAETRRRAVAIGYGAEEVAESRHHEEEPDAALNITLVAVSLIRSAHRRPMSTAVQLRCAARRSIETEGATDEDRRARPGGIRRDQLSGSVDLGIDDDHVERLGGGRERQCSRAPDGTATSPKRSDERKVGLG